MGEKIALFNQPLTVRYRGVFDIEGMYKAIISWINEQQMDYHETKYKTKPVDAGREIEIGMLGIVELNEFYRWTVKVDVKVIEGDFVDVVQNGVNKRMMRGRMLVKVSGELERDYSGILEKSPFWKKVGKVFFKLNEMEEGFKEQDTYFYKTVDLQKTIKQTLGMDTAQGAF
ncbi:MAG: hypothetical protein ACMXYC_03645 [Candidatus Woesearchaeota archaeon]